ncbi:MAG: radical SAM protein, partial [Candidatus Eisenbacteria bacterium]|nr:radical SAM protein [Candidatus Eisenbacteria bacterium]
SPEPVVEEMEYLVKRFGVREIRFWDDTFAADKARVLQMAELVAKRGVKVDVSIGTRADTLDQEVVAALKQIGVYNIIIGVESGVPKNLETLQKGQTREQVREAVHLVHKAGIRTFLTSIFGIPGETYEDGLETIRFVRSMKPDAAHFFTLCPFPGTELYRDLPKYGKVVEGDYSSLGMHTLPFEPYTMTRDEIEKLRRKAFITTTLYPEFIVKRLLKLRSLEEAKILLRGGSTVALMTMPSLMQRLRHGRTRAVQTGGNADCGSC